MHAVKASEIDAVLILEQLLTTMRERRESIRFCWAALCRADAIKVMQQQQQQRDWIWLLSSRGSQ